MTEQKLLSFYNDIKNTSSSKEKIKILENYILENRFFYVFLFYVYDFNKVYSLSKVNYTKNNNSNSIYYFIDILDSLRKREITGNKAISVVEDYLGSFNYEIYEILLKALQKNLGIGISAKTINSAIKNLNKRHCLNLELIPVFEVQLANKIDDSNYYKLLKEDVYVSTKLDGIRSIYLCNNGLFSRSGRKMTGYEEVVNNLKKINNYLSKLGYDIMLFDGEMYSCDLHFQEIISLTSKKDGDRSGVKFNMFAVWSDKFNSWNDVVECNKHINEAISFFKIDNISIVEQHKVEFLCEESMYNKILSLNEKFVNEGYEGVMVRPCSSKYEFKRGNSLLKYKSFKECDCAVIDIIEGEGKYAETLGKIEVRCLDITGLDYKTITAKCGSGFTDEERDLIWNNKKEFYDKIVEIKYLEVTEDKDGNLSLRHPVFLKIKGDM